VIDIIAGFLRSVCLPRPLTRDASGLVACDVLWELPTEAERSTLDAPVDCSERPEFLAPPPAGQAQRSANGNRLCTVTQVPVRDQRLTAAADGWYYDDFSNERLQSCTGSASQQRVAFTPQAKPPSGVKIKLVCLNETQHVVDADSAAVSGVERAASIGTSCESSMLDAVTSVDPDSRCAVQRSDGTIDQRLFCHPRRNTCVRSCQTERDCPPAWVCDTRPETLFETASPKRPHGSGMCVNPTCGS